MSDNFLVIFKGTFVNVSLDFVNNNDQQHSIRLSGDKIIRLVCSSWY